MLMCSRVIDINISPLTYRGSFTVAIGLGNFTRDSYINFTGYKSEFGRFMV